MRRPSLPPALLFAALAACGDSTGLDDEDLGFTVTVIPVGSQFEESASASFTKTGGIRINGAVWGGCGLELSARAEVEDDEVRFVVEGDVREGLICSDGLTALRYQADVPSLAPGTYTVTIDHEIERRDTQRMLRTSIRVP